MHLELIGYDLRQFRSRKGRCVAYRRPTQIKTVSVKSRKALCPYEQFALRIFARQCGSHALQRPLDTNGGVVPGNAALELGRPEICGFVKEFRGFAENQEAMRETRRHPDLFVVLSGKFFAHPLAECGG